MPFLLYPDLLLCLLSYESQILYNKIHMGIMFHSGIFSCSKKPKSRKLTEHPSDPLNFQAREIAEPNLCLQGMGKNSTHLFNFIQPFLILGQLGHEGLVLQPFLMKLLGLVSAAVPRHQHLFTHPIPQLCK